jgi:endonuclease/exonuclease/phosphatase family metal-dependent hydrolase
MESGVRVAAWNVCGALNGDERTPRAAEEIRSLDADVVVLPEATHNPSVSERDGERQNNALQILSGEGYTYSIFSCRYEDSHEGRSHRPDFTLWVLSRLAVQSQVMRAGTRNYLSLDIAESGKDPLRVDGVHLDDRAEANRVDAVTDLGNQDPGIDSPRVIAGDFNALDKREARARVYRSKAFKTLANLTPQERIRYAGERLHEMGQGTTMELMREFGFTDADPEHRPTALLGRFAIIAHLDKILYSQENTRAENFVRHHRSYTRERPVSDHCAISAVLHADEGSETYF